MQYKILGEPLPVVECHLASGEMMITERGAMSWMTPNMKMETKGGGVGKMFGRMFSMKTSMTDRKGGGAYDCEVTLCPNTRQ